MISRRALLGSAAASAAPAAPGGPARPDVLFILTDQWNPRRLGYAGDRSAPTPNLDRLAAEGVVFDNCYTPCPVCMPARTSLLSGLYPHNHGLWGNIVSYATPPEIAPMFRDIRAAGCTTAQIGKLHWTSGTEWRKHAGSLESYYRALGLDHAEELATPFSTPGGSGRYQEHLRRIGKLDAYCRDIAGRIEQGQYLVRPSAVGPEDHNDTFVAGAALDFLRQQPVSKPYCLVVSFPGPHPPLDASGKYASLVPPAGIEPPPNVPDRFEREGRTYDRKLWQETSASYYGKMGLIDGNIGRIVEFLKRRGSWDNTLVIFSADHGEMMGAHGFFSKGRFNEESARVPLLLRWPGRIQGGRRTAALAQLFDVYPTIVEAVGGKLSPGRFARSLLPVAVGKTEAVREAAFSEIAHQEDLNYMVRTQHYCWWVQQRKEALYDMRSDPYQMKNLIASPAHRETLQEIRLRHLDYFKSTQVNLSAGYQPMMQRLSDEGGGPAKGLADRLYEQFRRKQGLAP